MLGKDRLLIKHLKRKHLILFVLNAEIVEKRFFLFQTVQLNIYLCQKKEIDVRFQCFVIVSVISSEQV